MTSMTGSTESTTASTLTPTPTPTPAGDKPVGARGNKQGQTTFAAKINRWEILVNNLSQEAADLPKFKDVLDPFRVVLSSAKDSRDRQKVIQAESGGLLTQRKDLVLQGNDLYGRLRFLLKGNLGAQSDKLRAFGLKPSKKLGRRRSTGSTPPPIPEAPVNPVDPKTAAPLAASPHAKLPE